MKCKYCHKPVGLFSSKHKECELKHFALLSEIKEILLYKFESSELLDYLKLKQELILSLFLSVSFQMSVVRLANIINKFKRNFFL